MYSQGKLVTFMTALGVGLLVYIYIIPFLYTFLYASLQFPIRAHTHTMYSSGFQLASAFYPVCKW